MLISSGIQKLFMAWRYQPLTQAYFILLKSFKLVVFPPIIRRRFTSVSPWGLNNGFLISSAIVFLLSCLFRLAGTALALFHFQRLAAHVINGLDPFLPGLDVEV